MKTANKKSLKINYIYNLVFQFFALITILITTPYITKVLSAKLIGIYSYTYSIATYFILFGSMGISLYGQREIAYYQENKEKRSKVFFELFYLKMILLLITTIFFYLFFCIKGSYSIYYKILIFELIGNSLDIIWFYQGMEDFKKVVIRNIIIRLIGIVLIFLFVKTKEDLWKYILISSLSTFIGNLTLWIDLPKHINKVKFKMLDMKKHIKPILLLFMPQIAIQIYTVLDKTMIGLMTGNMSSVGIYQKTQEIVKMATTILTAFGTIIFSKIAFNYNKKNKEEISKCINTGFIFVWLIGIPASLGLIGISKNFISWYLGTDFISASTLLSVFSIILPIIGLNNVIGMQYLVATKKQKKFTNSVITGALINIVGNLILIRMFGVLGAIISSIISEIAITIIEFINMKQIIKGNINIKSLIKSMISSFIMLFIVKLIGNKMPSTIYTTLLQLTVGLVCYLLLLIILKEKNILDFTKQIRRKLNEKCNI